MKSTAPGYACREVPRSGRWAAMLSQDDRQRLEEIERHLMADDPRFVARMRSARRFPVAATTVVLGGVWIAAFAVALMARSTAMAVALLAILVFEAAWQFARRRRLT
jgi:Flp pilus assembly protein TadB